MAKAIMVQGTGSNVGKSMLVAGICRAFARRGLKVAPFKPQNMSNNAAVTPDGGEIGRAQALQARAASVSPHTDMNPILLKPETDTGAQVIVQGRQIGRSSARDYQTERASLLVSVRESFDRLCASADLVVIEGAGSPAEVNLRANDIANMGFACAAEVPVVLVGDIDRGGVIAQLVGTHAVLEADDNACIVAFAVNKFRGDVSLFDGGRDEIVRRTGWPCLGVVPWFADGWKLPAEDALDIRSHDGGALKVAVPQLSRIANFDDLDPLAAEPSVTVEMVSPGRPLPADADLVLIPGSKSTLGDLAFFRSQGWDIDLMAHVRRGGHVLGLCGGFQMLGHTLSDPNGVDGKPGDAEGLGLLDVHTVMEGDKRVTQVEATSLAGGEPVSGYEIHMGRTGGPDCTRAWLSVDGNPEGAASPNGRVRGSYLHGLFSSDAFRARFLSDLGHSSSVRYDDSVDQTLDDLADHLEQHMDLDQLLSLARQPVAYSRS